jgi:hypothetical protein
MNRYLITFELSDPNKEFKGLTDVWAFLEANQQVEEGIRYVGAELIEEDGKAVPRV